MVFGVIVSLVSFLCNTLWFLSQFAIFLIHYFFVLLILLCIVSKFIKLRAVPLESLQKIFSPSSFPISFLGSIFDAPENSKASFEYVSMSQYWIYWFFRWSNKNSFRVAHTTAREYYSASTWRQTVTWSFWTSKRWRKQKFTHKSAKRTLMTLKTWTFPTIIR